MAVPCLWDEQKTVKDQAGHVGSSLVAASREGMRSASAVTPMAKRVCGSAQAWLMAWTDKVGETWSGVK